MLSLDTETTGKDVYHDARPFFVTTCDENEDVTFWQWDVDPVTRMPVIPPGEWDEVNALVHSEEELVLQNPKFDVGVLASIGIVDWPWDRTWDTLLAGHLLSSNTPHNLTDMVLMYLGVNIAKYEDALQEAVAKARSIARSRYKDWKIAKEGTPGMPSAKGKKGEETWRFDYWLPRAVAKAEGYPQSHGWWTVLQEYGNADSSTTLPLFKEMAKQLKKRDLWEIYLRRLKVLPVAYGMENRGVTINKDRKVELAKQFKEEADANHRKCLALADYEIETLPVNGRSNDLNKIIFEKFKLQSNKATGKGGASMDKTVLEHWMATLDRTLPAYHFVKNLREYRRRKTALGYMESYEKFWLPWIPVGPVDPVTGADWYVLHPSLNPTGTNTLRWSSSNPNEQNISKQEGFNLRALFGPAPGREWWSCDAKNIELRIPAYEAGEEAMIDLFERPNDPPYYGSNHMLFFDILHPEKFAEHGVNVKKVYASTWYQWTKNGDFAVQYGAQEVSGTADRAYHVQGAQAKIQSRLGKINDLNQRMIEFANQHGYVETLPDRTVNPRHGYPLLCTRGKWGKILTTVPLSYHVQGTAMWVMQEMMLAVQPYLDQLNGRRGSQGYFMTIQVHDELVFDFPYVKDKGNLPIMLRIKKILDGVGNNLIPAVPLPVGIEYHEHSWAEGETLA